MRHVPLSYLIPCTHVHLCIVISLQVWEKLTRYFEIEPKVSCCNKELADQVLAADFTQSCHRCACMSTCKQCLELDSCSKPGELLREQLLALPAAACCVQWVTNRPGHYHALNEDLIAACDENTIGEQPA